MYLDVWRSDVYMFTLFWRCFCCAKPPVWIFELAPSRASGTPSAPLAVRRRSTLNTRSLWFKMYNYFTSYLFIKQPTNINSLRLITVKKERWKNKYLNYQWFIQDVTSSETRMYVTCLNPGIQQRRSSRAAADWFIINISQTQ